MKKIVEKSLEAALIKASTELGCSVVDLEYEVVQNSSNGFLGLGKKEAVIIVDTKNKTTQKTEYAKPKEYKEYSHHKPYKDSYKDFESKEVREPKLPKEVGESNIASRTDYEDYHAEQDFSQDIWGKQTPSTQQDDDNVAQIRAEIESLFAMLPFEIDTFEVHLEDDNTLSVYIDGRDCALLIGERGYRYKALSYLLFNWINPRYGYTLRLEIAEFLKNQEEMIDVYLKDIVRLVRSNGRAQTKTLEGILVYIALNKLRDIFPDKYVSVRQNEADEKYIIINDFRR
ncbi:MULTISPECIES: Jag N-terminal domain-containing protein [Helicobacter]|uniref:Protein jag n=1 Tax=Helicobacter typhlonius TaxID=76936 RepID=A0A099UHF1_9HELI|nr:MULTISPECIES: Jag N-terminal domain-containing protein [Helicobacter]TLD78575.1 protein jag [Helicobacter typhlonius]TLD89327.1 protein jag [Helicobacter sp. MIT 03-1616]CUU40184.1 RNA-binding protein Jag [Helicobacter typhlonius]